MEDRTTPIDLRPRPTSAHPLMGLTVLVVEDSRYTSEALRLLCLRSGARIRRADSVSSCERHLGVYRPTVAIVDLGLPDGSGLDVIAHMHGLQPRVPIILGTSGSEQEAAEADSRAAGADGFLPKPIASVNAFQAAILKHMPDELAARELREADAAKVAPDMIAYREDLSHAVALLSLDAPPLPYLRRFLLGVARSVEDQGVERRVLTMGTETCAKKAQNDLRSLLSARIQMMDAPV